MSDPFLQALEDRRLKREAERAAWGKRSVQLNAEGEADTIAKRVYLETVAAAQATGDGPVSPKPDAIETAPELAASGAKTLEDMPVKDMILSVLREAHPLGMTAKQIKGKAYIRFKKHINPNTLTVSLGRYSKPKEGEPRLARCEGRVWFYVRQPEAPYGQPALALLNGGKVHAAE